MSLNILNAVYRELDFKSGQLFNTTDRLPNKISNSDWLNKSEWLLAANKAEAEKVFFVDNNPVIVFAKCGKDKDAILESFAKVWSMARPRFLFLETEGELLVIDLAQKPDFQNKEIDKLETLKSIKDVAQKLQKYHRDNIESGKVFETLEKGRFGDRADKALISDLGIVRDKLIEAGLEDEKVKHAHALIGRSIFIRYLEDRGILTEDYFKKVAHQTKGWTEILKEEPSHFVLGNSNISTFYPRVLRNKDFTYALFKSLAKDFNGDMFPNVITEESIVKQNHLDLVSSLLYGDVKNQTELFLHLYRFDIVPLDLISSIYEQFYHYDANEDAKANRAHYTPSSLAEFVLSKVLTDKELKKNPVVLDPACGSGIFLVEAFRRMVRYKWKQKKRRLNFDEVKEILGNQIKGIEINGEAARIAAFSLYLSMLHYLEPDSILYHIHNENKLPNLIASKIASDKSSKNHFNSIHVANTFSIDDKAIGEIDVVVGNPPWGSPGNKADQVTKKEHKVLVDWCISRSYTIGDKEPSQAFLWRVLDFLKEDGRCALLTSAGVLLNHSSTSQEFRRKWMRKICLTEVFNFTHIRTYFFHQAIAPFALIYFKKTNQGQTPVEYWSPKQIVALKENQAVLLSKCDRAFLVNQDLSDSKTWKTNWFGRHADSAFIRHMEKNKSLLSICKTIASGFKFGNRQKELKWLKEFKYLFLESFSKYDGVTLKDFAASDKVEGWGKNKQLYSGKRILLKQGISANGNVVSRFERDSYATTNSIYAVKSDYIDVINGIVWSSFFRYYLFMTSSSWTNYHDKILLVELKKLPIPSNISGSHATKVVSIVQKLRNYHPEEQDVLNQVETPKEEIEVKRKVLEAELDEAVFDLYKLSLEERDLIRDCCEVTLPFFYQPYTSVGAMPAVEDGDSSWVGNYAKIFAKRWQPYLNDDEVMRADVHLGASGNMVAFEFYPADKGDKWNLTPKTDSWEYVIEEIGKALQRPMGTSQIILEGMVQVVSDDAIIIIKRNEKRFWTRSLAREDAGSTLAKRMIETMPSDGGIE